MSAYAKLRRQRQLFVDAYVETGIGTESARRAGYNSNGKSLTVMAAKILANPEVKLAVIERSEEAIAKAGARRVKFIETLCYRAYQAGADVRDVEGKQVTFAKMPAALLASVESIEFEADGRVSKIKLGTNAALRMLGDVLKVFVQVHEHSGKDGGPIQTEEVSDLEKARRIAHLLALGLRAGAGRPATPLSDADDSADASPDPDG